MRKRILQRVAEFYREAAVLSAVFGLLEGHLENRLTPSWIAVTLGMAIVLFVAALVLEEANS